MNWGDPLTWLWIGLTAVCFAVGFGLSWVRMKRRVIARYEDALKERVKQEVRDEILRRVAQGPELNPQPPKRKSGKNKA